MGILKDKVAIVTGALSSVSQVTAKKLILEGAQVLLTDKNPHLLSLLADSWGKNNQNISYYAADVAIEDDVLEMIHHTIDNFGKLDIFFYNSGIEDGHSMPGEYPTALFEKLFDYNLKGAFFCIKHIMPKIQDGGSIILSTTSGTRTNKNGSFAYNAMKHALYSMIQDVAIKLSSKAILVNTIDAAKSDASTFDEGSEQVEKDCSEEISHLILCLGSGQWSSMPSIGNVSVHWY